MDYSFNKEDDDTEAINELELSKLKELTNNSNDNNIITPSLYK